MLWVIDALSVLLVVVLGIVTSYEDVKYSRIRNKWVVMAIIAGFVLLALRFIIIMVTGTGVNIKYFTEFFLNFFIVFVVGVLLWEMKLWNPADAKLFLAYAALMPLSVYEWGYVNHFPSALLLINTFIPCFVFYTALLIIKTSAKEKLGVMKEVLQPKSLLSFFVFVFAFEWLIKLVFGFLKVKPQFLVTTLMLFVPLLFFEKVLKIDSFKFALAITLMRFIFDFKNILSVATLLDILKTFVTFFILRYFLLNLSSRFFAMPVKIKELKPGMMLTEDFYKEKGEIKKRKGFMPISYLSGVFQMARRKDNVVSASETLTKEDIEKIKKLHASGKIKERAVYIYQTVPFAPFLFLGVLLTLIFRGNFIIGLKILIESFI